MTKKSNKLNKKIILSALLIVIVFLNTVPISNAAKLSGEVNIYSIGYNDSLLLYKNDYFLTIFDVYENEENQYPVYNALVPTYDYNNPYEEELIDENSFLWQVVVNGYPYKTIEELGCNTYDEAFTATQVAIYCTYCNQSASDYTYFEGNESSLRTYNAFLNILENARKNEITINKNNVLKLINQQEDWNIDNEYVYKTYNVKTNYEIDNYKVKILNFESAKIVDENNNIKSEFKRDENFKILLPIEDLNKNGELEINIITDVETMPVYLGTSPYNTYILTAPRYEESTEKFSQTYQENLTSVNIEVREANTKIGIENSIINLLDSSKNKISTLTTNEQGKVFIEHLLPGTYYIEQITTEDGYITYKKLIQLNMEYNKVLNLTINNAEKNVQNFYNKEENITITEEIIEKNINEEIINKNINNKSEITNENKTNINYTENNEDIKNNVTNRNEETNINNKNSTTNENNTNINYKEDNENTEDNVTNKNEETNINNKNSTTNENNTNINYKEDNENTKNNVTNKNEETNINNKNNTINKDKINNNYVEDNKNIIANKNNNRQQSTEEIKKLPRTGM